MLIETAFKDTRKVERNRNYELKYKTKPVFLDITKNADFR